MVVHKIKHQHTFNQTLAYIVRQNALVVAFASLMNLAYNYSLQNYFTESTQSFNCSLCRYSKAHLLFQFFKQITCLKLKLVCLTCFLVEIPSAFCQTRTWFRQPFVYLSHKNFTIWQNWKLTQKEHRFEAFQSDLPYKVSHVAQIKLQKHVRELIWKSLSSEL